MTLVVAFAREAGNFKELVFASDSRLSGGQANDHAQKVFQLPRSDALFSFAGATEYAYPLMNQMIRSIEAHPNSQSRRLPLDKLKGHVLRVFQQSYSSIHSLPHNEKHPEDPDNFFLIGGFDWRTASITAWSLSFDRGCKEFIFRKILKAEKFYFAGDDEDAVREATRRTRALLRESGKTSDEIDMEPMHVLEQLIKDGKYSSIGGAPQLGKAYQHLNTRLFQVLWPAAGTGEVRPHMTGRPLLPGERSVWAQYDPRSGFLSLKNLSLKAEKLPDDNSDQDDQWVE